jgi:hypothetical protein
MFKYGLVAFFDDVKDKSPGGILCDLVLAFVTGAPGPFDTPQHFLAVDRQEPKTRFNDFHFGSPPFLCLPTQNLLLL